MSSLIPHTTYDHPLRSEVNGYGTFSKNASTTRDQLLDKSTQLSTKVQNYYSEKEFKTTKENEREQSLHAPILFA